ncbi:MAG: DinB family protein [Propionibacteriaceae bacterium]|jgi:hypothetical protein|nr:DinB family protein [Propionibacteriaceae bacterium]
MPVDAKGEVHHYLARAREALLWKLDGLGEYDLRRPLVPTGTNLLGLVKHLACCEVGYFGDSFGRPLDGFPGWWEEDEDDPNADLYATAEESSAEIIGWYRKACEHADRTIAELDADAIGTVAWWPEGHNQVSLHLIEAHMLAETSRHLGQADIVRELIDGAVGLRPGVSNVPRRDEAWWRTYHDKVEHLAREAASGDR